MAANNSPLHLFTPSPGYEANEALTPREYSEGLSDNAADDSPKSGRYDDGYEPHPQSAYYHGFGENENYPHGDSHGSLNSQGSIGSYDSQGSMGSYSSGGLPSEFSEGSPRKANDLDDMEDYSSWWSGSKALSLECKCTAKSFTFLS